MSKTMPTVAEEAHLRKERTQLIVAVAFRYGIGIDDLAFLLNVEVPVIEEIIRMSMRKKP
jgi:hypothetical protein